MYILSIYLFCLFLHLPLFIEHIFRNHIFLLQISTNKIYEITNNTGETLQLGIASSGLYTYSRVHGDYLYCQSYSTYNMYKINLVDNMEVSKPEETVSEYYITNSYYYQL